MGDELDQQMSENQNAKEDNMINKPIYKDENLKGNKTQRKRLW